MYKMLIVQKSEPYPTLVPSQCKHALGWPKPREDFHASLAGREESPTLIRRKPKEKFFLPCTHTQADIPSSEFEETKEENGAQDEGPQGEWV